MNNQDRLRQQKGDDFLEYKFINDKWIAKDLFGDDRISYEWCKPSEVIVKYLGVDNESTELGCICASFNMG
jgi:hypothetical protein